MRQLQTRDLGAVSKVISKMGIKKEVMDLFEGISGKSAEEIEAFNTRLVVELTFIILENYYKAEDEFYKLLATLSGKTVENIKKAPPKELIDMITELAKDDSLKYFFKLVA